MEKIRGGGNYKHYNVIPVRRDHTKEKVQKHLGIKGKKHWREIYNSADQKLIVDWTGADDDEKRLNPFHARNCADVAELKRRVEKVVREWREENGLI